MTDDFTFNTANFNRQLEDYGRSVTQDDASKMVRQVSFELLRLLIKGTPVGNPELWVNPESAPEGYVGGFARSNWFVTQGEPYEGADADIDASPGGSETLAAGLAAIGVGTKTLQAIWITNNTEYIEDLNAGHSSQAPAGFFEAAIEVVDQRFA